MAWVKQFRQPDGQGGDLQVDSPGLIIRPGARHIVQELVAAAETIYRRQTHGLFQLSLRENQICLDLTIQKIQMT